MTRELRRNNSTDVVLVQSDDGKYHVLAADEEIVCTSVLALAEVEFREAVELRGAAAKAQRTRERSHFEMQAVRSDSYARRATAGRKTGGKGGRGGV